MDSEEAHRALLYVEKSAKILGKADEHFCKVVTQMRKLELAGGPQLRLIIETAVQRCGV